MYICVLFKFKVFWRIKIVWMNCSKISCTCQWFWADKFKVQRVHCCGVLYWRLKERFIKHKQFILKMFMELIIHCFRVYFFFCSIVLFVVLGNLMRKNTFQKGMLIVIQQHWPTAFSNSAFVSLLYVNYQV